MNADNEAQALAASPLGPPPAPLTVPASSHRLPTVAASQALKAAKVENAPQTICLGLSNFDEALSGFSHAASPCTPSKNALGSRKGGLKKGEIVEVFGPPGVGKTAFALQACASVLSAGEKVIWVDAAAPLAGPRLHDAIEHSIKASTGGNGLQADDKKVDEALKNLTHFQIPSLAHFLALLVMPPPTFPPLGTGLIVIESWSVLLDHTYPRTYNDNARSGSQRDGARGLTVTERRKACIAKIGSSLVRLAVNRNIAIVASMKAVSKIMRDGSPAQLLPAIQEVEWTNILNTRISMYMDTVPDQYVVKRRRREEKEEKEEEEKERRQFSARFAYIARLKGSIDSSSIGGIGGIGGGSGSSPQEETDNGEIVAFEIDKMGMLEVDIELLESIPDTRPIIASGSPDMGVASAGAFTKEAESVTAAATAAAAAAASSSLSSPLPLVGTKRRYGEVADSEAGSDEYGSSWSVRDSDDGDDDDSITVGVGGDDSVGVGYNDGVEHGGVVTVAERFGVNHNQNDNDEEVDELVQSDDNDDDDDDDMDELAQSDDV